VTCALIWICVGLGLACILFGVGYAFTRMGVAVHLLWRLRR